MTINAISDVRGRQNGVMNVSEKVGSQRSKLEQRLKCFRFAATAGASASVLSHANSAGKLGHSQLSTFMKVWKSIICYLIWPSLSRDVGASEKASNIIPLLRHCGAAKTHAQADFPPSLMGDSVGICAHLDVHKSIHARSLVMLILVVLHDLPRV